MVNSSDRYSGPLPLMTEKHMEESLMMGSQCSELKKRGNTLRGYVVYLYVDHFLAVALALFLLWRLFLFHVAVVWRWGRGKRC